VKDSNARQANERKGREMDACKAQGSVPRTDSDDIAMRIRKGDEERTVVGKACVRR